MLSKVMSFALSGLEGVPVEVETDINNGLPAYELVGLPDAAVKESRERVRSALKNSGRRFPTNKITVNLAPADLKKEGAYFDLAIAVGILKATGQTAAAPSFSANSRSTARCAPWRASCRCSSPQRRSATIPSSSPRATPKRRRT